MKIHLKFFTLLFILSIVTSNVFSKYKASYPDNLKLLNQNFVAYFKNEINVEETEVEELLKELDNKGSWANIDYTSKQRGHWPVVNHLNNLHSIATIYQTESSKFFHNKSVSRKIHLALNYWLKNDFQCPNWWYPQIGVPKALAPVLFLMEDELSTKEIKLAMVILNRAKIGMTGQNKVWLSANVLMRSLLRRDFDTVKIAANSIQEELRTSMKEGIQPDWSYQQHGAQLQFGNYGLHYIEDMTKWISIFSNTPFAFEESKVSILRNYILNGQQWVVWKNAMDISACGRHLFVDEPVRKKAELLHYVDKMKVIDPSFKSEYDKMSDYKNTFGNRFFYRTDFQVQRSKDFYFSVKMCSDRVLGAESCNLENMLGYYMGDGVALLYQTEKEYENIFPFWDWKKVPGTTVSQDTTALPVLTAWGYHIQSDFVGGVSDGENGIAVMKYNRDNLQANKSWFMFNDMIVCLGNGINSSRGFNVTTSVNQSFLNGKVIISTNEGEKEATEIQTIENPNWILHDNVGYLFPNTGKVILETKTVKGAWDKVVGYYSPKEKMADIFKLWMDNGVDPTEEKYAYILVPNATKKEMQELEKAQPFKISNDKKHQIVETLDGKTAGIVFYEAGFADVLGGVGVSRPCVVMLKKSADGLSVFVADPTQKLTNIQLIFNEEFKEKSLKTEKGKTILDINLPNGFDAGKTVKLMLAK